MTCRSFDITPSQLNLHNDVNQHIIIMLCTEHVTQKNELLGVIFGQACVHNGKPECSMVMTHQSGKDLHISRCPENTLSLRSLGVVPKRFLTFRGSFYAMRSLVPVGHFRNISGQLLTCLRVFSVTPWAIVYRLYRVR